MKSSINIIIIILVIVNCAFGSKAPGNETSEARGSFLQAQSHQSLKELVKNRPPINTVAEFMMDKFQKFKKTISSLKDWTMKKLNIIENYGSEVIKKLNAPKIKNARDICLWKICSRPLKDRENSLKKTEIPITNSEVKKTGLKLKKKISDFENT